MNIIFRIWLFDFLFFIGDRAIKLHSPCGIRPDVMGTMDCLVGRLKHCCGRCEYLGENGCTTKCLGCKLTLCYDLKKRDSKPVVAAYRVLKPAKLVARRYYLSHIRTSRRESIEISRSPDQSYWLGGF